MKRLVKRFFLCSIGSVLAGVLLIAALSASSAMAHAGKSEKVQVKVTL